MPAHRLLISHAVARDTLTPAGQDALRSASLYEADPGTPRAGWVLPATAWRALLSDPANVAGWGEFQRDRHPEEEDAANLGGRR